MKKTVFLFLLLVCIGASDILGQTFKYGDIYYTVISEIDRTVRTREGSRDDGGSAGSPVSGDIVLPSKVEYNGTEYTLEELGEYSFYQTEISSIIIPNSVTEIGDEAFFYCYRLTRVKIPDSVTIIGKRTFSGCSGLTSVEIPNSVTSIGYEAFLGCQRLTSVTIGNSVTSIGAWAFFFCESLKSIEIPNSITEIGDGAFAGCLSLRSINVNNENPSFSSVDGILYNKNLNTLISYPGGLTGDFKIPNSVTTIGNGAFSGCTGLKSVTIPNSVTTIGSEAFNSCWGLSIIVIPSSVETIGAKAFFGCKVNNFVIGCGIKEIGEYGICNDNSSNFSNLFITALEAPTVAFGDYFKETFDKNIYIPETSFDSYARASYFWNDFLYFKDLISPTGFTTNKLEINGRRGTQETVQAVFTPGNTTLKYIWVSGYDPEVVSVNWDINSTNINITILDGDKGTDIIVENLYANNNRTVIKVNGGGSNNPDNGDEGGNGGSGEGGNGDDSAVDDIYSEMPVLHDVYTLQGVCVKRQASQSDIDTLNPGIYIINGKKVLVR